MKACSKCKVLKEKSCFSPDKRTKTGLASWCKPCFNENFKLKYLNLDKYKIARKEKAANYNRSAAGKKYHKEYMKQYSKNQGKQYLSLYLKDYEEKPNRILYNLNRRLLIVKKESTKQKLAEQIKHLENEITLHNFR